jgi:hypothetical protein
LTQPAGFGALLADDLAELVDRPIPIPPLPGDLHAGLVHLPTVADGVSAGPGGVGE